MDYEIITVFEYCGNNLERTRQAKIYANGTLEYLPEPEWSDDIEEVSEEDEEEQEWIMS